MMNHNQMETVTNKLLKITIVNNQVKTDRSMLIMVAKMMNFSLI